MGRGGVARTTVAAVDEIHSYFLVVVTHGDLVIYIYAAVLGDMPVQVNGFACGIFLTHDLNNFSGCHC
jgi:hypothetical protein